jgi:hypothetical protein
VEDIQDSISKRTDGLWRRATRRFGAGRRATPKPTPLDVDQLAEKVPEKVATRLATQGQQAGNSPPDAVN